MEIQAFIANYVVPKALDEMYHHWIETGTADNIEQLHEDYWNSGNIGIWTVPRWAKVGDVVFLMESVSSIQHIKKLIKDKRIRIIFFFIILILFPFHLEIYHH